MTLTEKSLRKIAQRILEWRRFEERCQSEEVVYMDEAPSLDKQSDVEDGAYLLAPAYLQAVDELAKYRAQKAKLREALEDRALELELWLKMPDETEAEARDRKGTQRELNRMNELMRMILNDPE